MTPSAIEGVPAPIRRVVAYTVVALVVYAVLLAAGSLLLGPAAAPGSTYSLSATVAAGVAALYLVYMDGLARLRDLVR